MSKNLTFSLLSELSNSKLAALEKYLKSAFFLQEKSSHIIINTYINARKRERQSPEFLYAKVFPGEQFDQRKWNKALSALNIQISDFLAIQQFQQKTAMSRMTAVEAFHGLKNDVLFHRAIRAIQDENGPEKTDDWWMRYQAKKLDLTHANKERTKDIDKGIDDLDRSMDTFYFITKLKIACNRLVGERTINWSSPRQELGHLLERAQQVAQTGHSPLLHLYCALTSMMAGIKVDFDQFYQKLQQYGSLLDPSELWSIVYQAFEHCHAVRRTDPDQAFECYAKLLPLFPDIRTPENQLWEEAILNIGLVFATFKKKKEFDQLLKTKSASLPDERREDALHLLWAYWHFHQNDYTLAHQHLTRVTTYHQRYSLRKHALAVRNAYMLYLVDHDTELVDAALERFGEFVKRQSTFSAPMIKPYSEMLWFIRKMSKYNPDKAELMTALEKKQPAARDWLQKMLDQLPSAKR